MLESTHDPEVLLQHYLEDCLTEAGAVAFLELLKAQPELGDRLLGQLQVDAMLQEMEAVGSPTLVPLPQNEALAASSKPAYRRPTYIALAGVAALAACITLAASWALHLLSPANDAEATTAAVAVLARGVNLEWEGASHATGSSLTPGWLRLKSVSLFELCCGL